MLSGDFKWPKIGNELVLEFLSRSLKNHKIAQAYAFIGSDELGKSTIALAYARNLQGEISGFNNDLYILKPAEEKKSISISEVREFVKTLGLSSFTNSYKIGIIKEADKLTVEAQSALLKTLEEPCEKVIIILLISEEEKLLKTILSRSQVLYFNPVPASLIYDYLIDNYSANRSLAKDLSQLALGRPLKAIRLFEHQDDYQEYLEKAKIFLLILKSDFNSSLEILNKIFNDKGYSASTVNNAKEVLLMMEGLFRDLLLLNYNQPEKIQHAALNQELKGTLEILDKKNHGNCVQYILSQFKSIASAKEYLMANVNPRLVLEQVIINL